jgi:hypothetical protein
MFSRRSFWVAVGAACSACSDDPPLPLRSELPVEATDRSVIVAIRRESALDVHAFRLINGEVTEPWILPLTESDTFRLFALAYTEDLETLGLQPGKITPAETNEISAPLPPTTRAFEQTFANGQVSAWSTKPFREIEPELASFRISIASRCVDFELTTLSLPHDDAPRFALDAQGRLLFGDVAGRLFVSPPGGPISELDQTGQYFDAYADDEGTLWLSAGAGGIFSGRLVGEELELVQQSTVTIDGSARDVLFLDGDKTAGVDDRFALVNSGHLAHDDGNGWVQRYHGRGPRGLAWIGANDARAVQGYEPEVYHPEAVDPEGDGTGDAVNMSTIDGGVTVIGHVRGYGVYAGMQYGALRRRVEEDNWSTLTIEPAHSQVRGIAEYPAGFVYARPDGVIQVLARSDDPREQACPNGQLISQPNDPQAPVVGFDVGESIGYGARTELTVVDRHVAVFGTQLEGGVPKPVLFWLLAPGR